MPTGDLYAAFTLPPAVLDAVRAEERRLGDRLTKAGMPYEMADAIRDYQRAVCPMLSALASSVDPEGAPDEGWTREYIARRAAMEGDAVFGGVETRYQHAVAFAASHLKETRSVFHKNERVARVQSKA